MVVCLWLYHHILSSSIYIYIPWTQGRCFRYWCAVYGMCNGSDTLWPVCRVRLFTSYTISLSSFCRLIWRHWTTKMLVSVAECISKVQSILSTIFYLIYLQLTQFTCDHRENVYIIFDFFIIIIFILFFSFFASTTWHLLCMTDIGAHKPRLLAPFAM